MAPTAANVPTPSPSVSGEDVDGARTKGNGIGNGNGHNPGSDQSNDAPSVALKSKDPNRPKRKKARRACYACQRAHLTCGESPPV